MSSIIIRVIGTIYLCRKLQNCVKRQRLRSTQDSCNVSTSTGLRATAVRLQGIHLFFVVFRYLAMHTGSQRKAVGICGARCFGKMFQNDFGIFIFNVMFMSLWLYTCKHFISIYVLRCQDMEPQLQDTPLHPSQHPGTAMVSSSRFRTQCLSFATIRRTTVWNPPKKGCLTDFPLKWLLWRRWRLLNIAIFVAQLLKILTFSKQKKKTRMKMYFPSKMALFYHFWGYQNALNFRGLTGNPHTISACHVKPRNHQPLGIKTKSPGPQVPSCHDSFACLGWKLKMAGKPLLLWESP